MFNKVIVPKEYNYIGVFLTLACNLTCSYCINHLSGKAEKKGFLNGDEWSNVLNRLILPPNLPISIQGGEPTVHPHFYKIIKNLREDIPIDLLTNLQFDPIEFSKNIPPERLKREAPYASIRVTYHPETMKWSDLVEKILFMKKSGYEICVYGILHPRDMLEIDRAQAEAKKLGIDFKTKEFLGVYEGKIHGNYLYKDSVFSETLRSCMCKPSELLIGVDGDVYRCHHDLYNKYNSLGSLNDQNYLITDDFSKCTKFGKCNPCDVKIKNNRFQEWGHTSVQIKDIN